MNYYHEEFEKLQEEFHDVMHNYPLFKEMIDSLYDNDIKEINDLLNKNDEYYLKEAISKLKDVINYVKDTNQKIEKEYREFDKLAGEWDKIKIATDDSDYIKYINDKVNKANILIKSHEIKEIEEANKIMEEMIKEVGNGEAY